MKILFASDLHGSAYYTKKVLNEAKLRAVDQIVLLGDLMYHGPRNELPNDYNPKEVAELLNQFKDKIIAVRGNCDSEVDQMLLEFPMLSDYTILYLDGIRFFVTHGHLYNENKWPNIHSGDVLIYGHFHVPITKVKEGIFILNPNSVSLPKEGRNSFGFYEDRKFSIIDFEDRVVQTIDLN